MKTMYFLVTILIALFLFTSLTTVSIAASINIPGLFNTGVDDSGNPLTSGSLEQHYVLTGMFSPAYANTQGTDGWVTPTGNAMWINPPIDSRNVAGDYVYTLNFDLSGFNPADITISGQWASDNGSAIYLNGVKTQYEKDALGFLSVQDFSIDSGFLPTNNTFEFHVNNLGGGPNNPTGLLVQNLQATPEPATLFLLTLGGLTVLRKKK